MVTRLADVQVLAGRWCLAALFVAGTVQKLLDPAPAMALLAAWSWPVWLVWPAALFNALGAASLLSGLWLRPMATALALYCMVTSLFHFLPADSWQMSIFVKNWAIAGGLLILSGVDKASDRTV